MKLQRGDFDQLAPAKVKEYCLSECRLLAELVRRLVEAHAETGLHLKSYYGAGSTGAAMLELFGIKKQARTVPEIMKMPVAQGFFGGRFENSVIGPIEGPVYAYDISSAYPYHTRWLPCLGCGAWRLTRRWEDVLRARIGLVRYGYSAAVEGSWAPFPYRDELGTIFYPAFSAGDWVWREEFLSGQSIWPNNVIFREAWIFESDCNHEPFADLPRYYLERLALGKDTKGLVLKLGMNSCYGKLAQSVGSAPYQCWVWAGLITSGTRAQLLRLMQIHACLSNCLMVATDGLYSRELVDPPSPRDNGTDHVAKPLGGWERAVCQGGVIAIRPGIYFALDPSQQEIEMAKGRGLGPRLIQEQWRNILQAYLSGESEIPITKVARFCGAKTSFSVRSRGTSEEERHRSCTYGTWVEREIVVSFRPRPKRECANGQSLTLRVNDNGQKESWPYARALLEPEVISPEAMELKKEEDEKDEQPSGDYCFY